MRWQLLSKPRQPTPGLSWLMTPGRAKPRTRSWGVAVFVFKPLCLFFSFFHFPFSISRFPPFPRPGCLEKDGSAGLGSFAIKQQLHCPRRSKHCPVRAPACLSPIGSYSPLSQCLAAPASAVPMQCQCRVLRSASYAVRTKDRARVEVARPTVLSHMVSINTCKVWINV